MDVALQVVRARYIDEQVLAHGTIKPRRQGVALVPVVDRDVELPWLSKALDLVVPICRYLNREGMRLLEKRVALEVRVRDVEERKVIDFSILYNSSELSPREALPPL
eukprot:CAMPEP_0195655786 /NCGR_PEP_ID=MMETSP0815-20121206/34644_1 /TAXON_ID=97485 /ORGANISM="Prymnesium parvum, Strain Texoma1" /LENGTH=106 /DNA_ID=CAMNT_0040800097 /DNA_START=354 /DNA_END=675 /DNA_ORIENTATION=+